ncbi:hypothetical protein Droror1_Dr00022810 [Drosera rotundifolia]
MKVSALPGTKTGPGTKDFFFRNLICSTRTGKASKESTSGLFVGFVRGDPKKTNRQGVLSDSCSGLCSGCARVVLGSATTPDWLCSGYLLGSARECNNARLVVLGSARVVLGSATTPDWLCSGYLLGSARFAQGVD